MQTIKCPARRYGIYTAILKPWNGQTLRKIRCLTVMNLAKQCCIWRTSSKFFESTIWKCSRSGWIVSAPDAIFYPQKALGMPMECCLSCGTATDWFPLAPATPFGNAGVCALVKAYLLVNKKTYLDAAEKLLSFITRQFSIVLIPFAMPSTKKNMTHISLWPQGIILSNRKSIILRCRCLCCQQVNYICVLSKSKDARKFLPKPEKFTGLSFVSTQSHCIHSLFPCYELKQLAEITENKFYGAISKLTTTGHT